MDQPDQASPISTPADSTPQPSTAMPNTPAVIPPEPSQPTVPQPVPTSANGTTAFSGWNSEPNPSLNSVWFVIVIVVAILMVAGGGVWWYHNTSHITPVKTGGVKSTSSPLPSPSQAKYAAAPSASPTKATPTPSSSPKKATTTPTPSTPAPQGTGFDTIVNEFLTAMNNQGKTTADSLESPAFQEYLQTQDQTTSFYSMCVGYGQLCTAFFAPTFINSSTKTTGSYTATDGIKGEQITYTSQSSNTNGQGGQGQSTSTTVFDGIPNGSSWLIDNITFQANGSASGL